MSNNKPFFTVIIPTYNRAKFLPETLLSVQNQSFKNWECIIVDDGSTDNTHDLVSDWMKEDNRFCYIYQENAERSAARNNGIENAKGEYVCFLDSDDKYLPENLESWYGFLEKNKHPKSFNFCDSVINYNGEKKEDSISNFDIHVVSNYLFYPIIPARVCIHKSLLKDFRFELDTIICEDVCLWMRIVNEFPVYKSHHLGAEYLLHDENSISLTNPAAIKMHKGLSIFFQRYPEIRKQFPNKVYADYLSKIQTNIAKFYLRKNKRGKAIISLLKAIFAYPLHVHTKFRVNLVLLSMISSHAKIISKLSN